MSIILFNCYLVNKIPVHPITYSVAQGLVVQVHEVIEDEVVRREDRLAQGLGHAKVLQGDQTDQFLRKRKPIITMLTATNFGRQITKACAYVRIKY